MSDNGVMGALSGVVHFFGICEIGVEGSHLSFCFLLTERVPGMAVASAFSDNKISSTHWITFNCIWHVYIIRKDY